MESSTERTFRKLAVIGAGNMGAGIAQMMAAAGFGVTLVDLDDEAVGTGRERVERSLAEGVERRVFRPEQAERIRGRIRATTDWDDLADCYLVVEAVFEDEAVKQDVFRRLDDVCRTDAILATNTSTLSVTRLAEATRDPRRVVGLHYFYHPAKNRLVEVVAGRDTAADTLRAVGSLQEQLGRTAIASKDVPGFVVDRFHVPWLNEAARLVDDGVADAATIEESCKVTFGVGTGPFELMNDTGLPDALHGATTLGRELGPFYAPADGLRRQGQSGESWAVEGRPDVSKLEQVADRMRAVVFYVSTALVEQGVGSLEDTEIGARVGLRWPRGPFRMMNDLGTERAAAQVAPLAGRWELSVPDLLASHATRGQPFAFRAVRSELHDGVVTLTVNRPDAMNALNEDVVRQLHESLRRAIDDPDVHGIVIAGAGRTFIAGADVGFFARNIEAGTLDRIVEFAEAGHALLDDIAASPKPVIARMHGRALGGGLELALACRRTVAATHATMAFPETGIGIYPVLGGTQRTPRRIGPDLAKWLIHTGEPLAAPLAQQVGLVDDVVAHAELDRACRDAIMAERRPGGATWPVAFAELASFFGQNSIEDIRLGKADTRGNERLVKAVKRVNRRAPVALRIAERLIDEGAARPLEEALRLELEHLREVFGTEDAYAGLSTIGKKKPTFRGR
jgi:enoyl-CoA hydratase/3-hydroxyacyl-CoA dehydrogenase